MPGMDFDYGLRYCYEVILLNFCPYCGARTSPESQFCTACGSRLGSSPNPAPDDKNIFEKVTDKLGRMSGVDGKVELKVKDLFSDIFKKHTTEESEAIFISGTAATTPPEETIASTWPKPWLYTRVFLMFMATFLLLYICVMEFSNINALPGLIMIGSLVIPFSLILFFMELNVPRNISFFMIMKVFFLGGCASLLLSLLLYEIFPGGTFDYLQAIVTGVVEEVAKLAIIAFIIYRMPKMKYMLNGMLVGAAVGAGFAAFESAGYAFPVRLGIRGSQDDGCDHSARLSFTRRAHRLGGHRGRRADAGQEGPASQAGTFRQQDILLLFHHTGRAAFDLGYAHPFFRQHLSSPDHPVRHRLDRHFCSGQCRSESDREPSVRAKSDLSGWISCLSGPLGGAKIVVKISFSWNLRPVQRFSPVFAALHGKMN